MFADGSVSFENGSELVCETDYPYDFTVKYTLKKGENKTLAIRIPAWSRKNELSLNGKKLDLSVKKGYVYLEVKSGDQVTLSMDGTPKFQFPSPKIHSLTGKAAVMRGPLVYCFEGKDNEGDVLSLYLKDGEALSLSRLDAEPLAGVTGITASAVREDIPKGLYTDEKPEKRACEAKAVPYYTWGNRGENQMRVWMNID